MPKPSRSAFYFYALEYQRRQQRTGQRLNINEAITACYDEWKALSDDEKQPYKVLYEEWRVQYRLDPEAAGAFSSQQSKKKALKQEMKNEKILSERDIPCEELKLHYDRFSIERDYLAFEYLPLDIQELLHMPIYLVNYQIFCKVDEEDGGQYIPAEFALARFTLAEGVTSCQQIFLKPDRIPAGYMSACLEHLKLTHQIPMKDFAQATDNYSMIYQKIKSLLSSSNENRSIDSSNSDDRSRRRYQRLRQPCVFFPALEYEQTSRLFDWLQEKAEGVKPTKETRLVNFASVESLIMLLAELKQQRVSRDDIHKTFENAAYSFMIEERCDFHSHLGISHCAVARCYAAAKLISAYLNQLYVPERPTSTLISSRRPQSSAMNKSERSSIVSMNVRDPQPIVVTKPPVTSSQYSTTGTSDSIASSYVPSEQRKKSPVQATRSFVKSSASAKYPYQSSQAPAQVSDELIHHPTIMKLQQQNFHRLLSSAASTTSSSSAPSKPLPLRVNPINDDQTSVSTMTNLQHSGKTLSDNQRTVLHQRKQALMRAIQNIDQQMEDLNMQ